MLQAGIERKTLHKVYIISGSHCMCTVWECSEIRNTQGTCVGQNTTSREGSTQSYARNVYTPTVSPNRRHTAQQVTPPQCWHAQSCYSISAAAHECIAFMTMCGCRGDEGPCLEQSRWSEARVLTAFQTVWYLALCQNVGICEIPSHSLSLCM